MIGRRVVAAMWKVRWALVAALIPVVAWAAWAASHVGVDNAVTVWFVDDDPALAVYREFQHTFGNDEVAVLAVHAPGGVITVDGLARIDAVSRAAQAVDGIVEVTSITTLDHIRVQEGWTPDPAIDEAPPVEIGPIVRTLPTDAAGAERIHARIAEDPLVRGVLVSDDFATALVIARMGDFEGMDKRRDGILADLSAAVDASDGAHVPMAGIGVVFSALNVASTRDALVVGAASYLVIVLVLILVLGRTGPVILTIAAVGVSALVSVAIYAVTGHDLNMVTLALPTLVLIIAVADVVHMLENVAAQPPGDQAKRVEVGVGDVLWPCLFTSATTAAGFVSLVTAKMQVVRDLGIYAGIGVMIAYVVSVIIVVAGLQWKACEPAPRSGRRLLWFMVATGEFSMRNARSLLAGSLLVALAGAWGMSRLQVDTFSIDYFYPAHPVRQDSTLVEETFGPYTPLEFEVVADDGVRKTDVLAAIGRWQDAMETDPDVGWSRSVVGVVRRLNQVLTDGEPASYVVPGDELALEQALFVYESDPDVDLGDQVDPDWTRARVTVGLKMLSAKKIESAMARLEAQADLPEGVRIVPAGYLPLYVAMMDYIVRSQVTSFASAFVLVFGLLALMLRSARLALIAVPSNIVPLFVTLGLMGIAGIRLDVATVTIAAIVLGLVVDDTTHFLYRFRESLHEHGDHERAVRETNETAGVALATTTLVLVLGFSVLGLAQVKSVALFGVLSAIAMASALIADVLMLPALLVMLRPRL